MRSFPVRPDQSLRDLQWSIESPSLISMHPPAELRYIPFRWGEIQARLERFFTPPQNHRVGKYFEALIQFWIGSVSGAKILGQNLQVRSEGRTQGEIDLVYETNTREVVHVETAVKFYLFHPTQTVLDSHFIGPNTGDTLERKLNRLLKDQIRLVAPELPTVHQHHAYVKGRIFYHPNHSPPKSFPPHLSPNHAVGTWIHHSEWEAYNASTDYSYFRILKKPYWLASEIISTTTQNDLLDSETMSRTLDNHFSTSPLSLLLAAFATDENGATEQRRIFVVNNQWPTPASTQ